METIRGCQNGDILFSCGAWQGQFKGTHGVVVWGDAGGKRSVLKDKTIHPVQGCGEGSGI